MAINRTFSLGVAQTTVPLPCFFPSVSSVKTILMPVDYMELLMVSNYPYFLVSAYDIANSPPDQSSRIERSLRQCKETGVVILMDSGNYEAFWKADSDWTPSRFHKVVSEFPHDVCFCHDNQNPPDTAQHIAQDVVSSVLRDQKHALGSVVPIIHGSGEMLSIATRIVVEYLFPILLAVPERALGDGIIARIKTIKRIRKALDEVGVYCPLHLRGTGNPLSIAVYAMAGADSFDGLEWCQTVVDHQTAQLFHFQHWDLFKEQTQWGTNGVLPYVQSALMHNLEFYQTFMTELREALIGDNAEGFLRRWSTEKQADLLLRAIEGDD